LSAGANTPAARVAQRPAPREAGALAVLALCLVGATIVVFRLGHGVAAAGPPWDDLAARGGWSPGTFLRPHDGGLSLVPVALLKVWRQAGLDGDGAYRALLLGAHCATVVLVYLLLRRRLDPVFATGGAIGVLILGAAWPSLLVAERLGYDLAVVFGLGMLLALDARREVVACVLLALALGSSTLGLAFALMMLVETAARRGSPRRYWIVVVPLALYALWALGYGNPATPPGTSLVTLARANIPALPGYVANGTAAAFGALTGLGDDWGRPLAVVAVVALGLYLSRGRPPSVRLVSLLTAAVAYWVSLAFFRAQLITPADSRYLYFGAIVIVLVAGEMLAGAPFTPRAAVILAVALIVAAVANYGLLRDAAASLRSAAGLPSPPGSGRNAIRPATTNGANVTTWSTTAYASARASPIPYGCSATSTAASKTPTEAGAAGSTSANVVAAAMRMAAS
jgi:hypothetical protein